MRIAYVTAGAAGMYCGSCLHDNTPAAALIRDGHDVSLIPTYTPIRTDEEDVGTGDVFYGAINVYLEQNPFTIGYLARICPEKGLHLPIEVYERVLRSYRARTGAGGGSA